MSPELLLLLLVALRSESAVTGNNFIAVFPENIAYYYPFPPENKVRVLALYNDTTVTLNQSSSTPMSLSNDPLMAGQTREYPVFPSLELNKSTTSTSSISIKSTGNITVEILSQRNNSVQTALIVPTDQLGTNYKVPAIPLIQGTTQPHYKVTQNVTERSPFRLIIVNGPDTNNVQIKNENISLGPNGVAQVNVTPDTVGKAIKGERPFLVLFSHSCAIQYNCTCGLLYTPLLPDKTDPVDFYIPPFFSQGVENDTYLLMLESAQSFSSKRFPVKANGTVVLQRPGLLINLIHEKEFGSCFAIQTVNNTTNWAIIMVPKNKTNGTWIGRKPLSTTWQDVPGGTYVSAKVPLNESKNIVWHASAPMAVWFVGMKVQEKSAWFGNPAPLISKDQDPRGCVLVPDLLMVGDQEQSWQESIQFCKNQNLSLVSLSDKILQDQVYKKIRNLGQNLTVLWIGLRRSSYTGEWYWLSGAPFNTTDWGPGEPGGPSEGQCTQLRLKNKELYWIDSDCCSPAKPVCYRAPVLLPRD